MRRYDALLSSLPAAASSMWTYWHSPKYAAPAFCAGSRSLRAIARRSRIEFGMPEGAEGSV
jgi:hypothetical protein